MGQRLGRLFGGAGPSSAALPEKTQDGHASASSPDSEDSTGKKGGDEQQGLLAPASAPSMEKDAQHGSASSSIEATGCEAAAAIPNAPPRIPQLPPLPDGSPPSLSVAAASAHEQAADVEMHPNEALTEPFEAHASQELEESAGNPVLETEDGDVGGEAGAAQDPYQSGDTAAEVTQMQVETVDSDSEAHASHTAAAHDKSKSKSTSRRHGDSDGAQGSSRAHGSRDRARERERDRQQERHSERGRDRDGDRRRTDERYASDRHRHRDRQQTYGYGYGYEQQGSSGGRSHASHGDYDRRHYERRRVEQSSHRGRRDDDDDDSRDDYQRSSRHGDRSYQRRSRSRRGR